MTDIYVTDKGFEAWPAQTGQQAPLLSVTDNPQEVIGALYSEAEIHIPFSSAADGRGFSLARSLRDAGYQGRLIAVGALVCDQYRHARQSGFDGVLITSEQAEKMPQQHWLEQAKRVPHSYAAQIYQP
ncbi:MAG: DUF934 domain-containing protein [Candidatus Puniceispirillaceae bacterium]